MSNLIGAALVHIRAAERDGVAARTMPAARKLSMTAADPLPRRAVLVPRGRKRTDAEQPFSSK